jgi:hypothetical protein
MLFHITGPSGSGKTTLGQKLSQLPNTLIIDTDEIDDSNALEILENPEFKDFFLNENTINGFWKMLERKNMEKLSELLNSNKNSNIIIVGMTIYPPGETNVQGYSIDISSDSNYYQLNKRSLDTICSNCVELKDLMSKNKNKYITDLTILFKYKLRHSFPILPIQIEEGIDLRKKHSQELGYKYLTQEKIVSDIIDILSKQKSKSKSKSKPNEKSKTETETEANIMNVKSGLMRYKKTKSKSK